MSNPDLVVIRANETDLNGILELQSMNQTTRGGEPI